jgi:phosphoesterase RecJ-like protein
MTDNQYYQLLHDQFKIMFKEIKNYDRIVVFRHEVPDFDALGTQMGLVTWLKESFPNKEVHYVGEGMHSFIPRIFPEPENVSEAWYDEKPFLAIIVDTSNVDRISDDHFKKAASIIKFDHHPEVEKFANISCVHPEMAACSELVALFIETMGDKKYPLSKNAAYYFYIGIVGDSGRFRFPEVSPMTFRLAADLLQTGIKKEEIYSKMYFTSAHEFEFKKWVLTNFKISKGGTAYYILRDADLKKLGLEVGDGKIHLDLFRDVEGINCSVSITEDVSKGEYRLSFRSETRPVSKVASMYGGGGHLFAAGGKLKSLDQLDSLIKDLDDLQPVPSDSLD